jgi:hypothetical protein
LRTVVRRFEVVKHRSLDDMEQIPQIPDLVECAAWSFAGRVSGVKSGDRP